MEQFHFKEFSVAHDHVTWKVGTDGILLGAWCDVRNAEAVLDLGTGTGLLALMIAQRNKAARVKAIEIDYKTTEIAIGNFASSLWQERLEVVCRDAISWSRECAQTFDLIVSNPPYFDRGLISPNHQRKNARSGDGFGMQEVLDIADLLLSEKGILSVILPFERAEAYIDQASRKGLVCLRKMHVRHRSNIGWTRSLLEFSRTNDTQIQEEYLTLYHDDKATEAYVNLISEFRDA